MKKKKQIVQISFYMKHVSFYLTSSKYFIQARMSCFEIVFINVTCSKETLNFVATRKTRQKNYGNLMKFIPVTCESREDS